MRMVRLDALLSWTRLKEYREVDPFEYEAWDADRADRAGNRLIFVSHRWISPHHPDPNGEQLRELQQRLAPGAEESALVFYDYCSLPQRPRAPDEDATFHRDIRALGDVLKSAEKVIILSEGYHDYKNRSWCFFEAIASEANVHFFDDQAAIKTDLDFLTYLLGGLEQITSFDFSYKLNVEEAEIIVATFQHLKACRATHADDVPLIKQQMVAHFNNRRLTSFGRLITGVAKFFDLSFSLIPLGTELASIPCKPYFEEPGWRRLPTIQLNPMKVFVSLGRSQRSVFALPDDDWEAAKQHHTDGFMPALRLSLPQGVRDPRAFLNRFQADPDWQRYVVQPITRGTVMGDPFPTIDHVMHTALERRPGLAVTNDSIYFVLVDEG